MNHQGFYQNDLQMPLKNPKLLSSSTHIGGVSYSEVLGYYGYIAQLHALPLVSLTVNSKQAGEQEFIRILLHYNITGETFGNTCKRSMRTV